MMEYVHCIYCCLSLLFVPKNEINPLKKKNITTYQDLLLNIYERIIEITVRILPNVSDDSHNHIQELLDAYE